MNKLNGRSMSQCLPTGDFHEVEFTNRKEKNFLKTISRTPDNKNCGYLLECDLRNPSFLLEKTKHFPFLPDIKTKVEDYSPCMMENTPKKHKRTEKVILDLTNKITSNNMRTYILYGTCEQSYKNTQCLSIQTISLASKVHLMFYRTKN